MSDMAPLPRWCLREPTSSFGCRRFRTRHKQALSLALGYRPTRTMGTVANIRLGPLPPWGQSNQGIRPHPTRTSFFRLSFYLPRPHNSLAVRLLNTHSIGQ